MNLTNKTILITGANRGIGRALVEEALTRGAKRVYAATRQPFAHSDERVMPLTLDVTNAVQIQGSVGSVGSLDILVNNAGVWVIKPLLEQTDDDFDRVIAVNLRGTWLFLRAVAPGMVARGRGAIVNLASIAAFTYTVATGAYGASKAGVVALTRDAAFELAAHGVRVNAIAPGNIANPRRSNRWPPSAGVPLGSGGPEDIAGAVRFLVTDASRYVIGQTITVAGGGDLSVSAGWG